MNNNEYLSRSTFWMQNGIDKMEQKFIKFLFKTGSKSAFNYINTRGFHFPSIRELKFNRFAFPVSNF